MANVGKIVNMRNSEESMKFSQTINIENVEIFASMS